MTTSYLLQAVRDEEILWGGTAWLLGPQTVVTAFHVVGDARRGEWLGAKLPGLEYRLLAADGSIALQPLDADEAADIAWLKAAHTPAGVRRRKQDCYCTLFVVQWEEINERTHREQISAH